jgi:excisionase family DNA binding protein
MIDLEKDRLMTVLEAAEVLRIHANTLRKWTDTGKIGCIRLPNGHRRIPRVAVEKIIRQDNCDA